MRNSGDTPGYNEQYNEPYTQLDQYAASENSNKTCQFLVVNYSSDEFNQFVQSNLKRLGIKTAKITDRFCAEKFFISVLAKVNAKYGSANVIEGAVNVLFYPYRHQDRQALNFPNYVSPPIWNSRTIINDNAFFIPQIPMCMHCQANAPEKLLQKAPNLVIIIAIIMKKVISHLCVREKDIFLKNLLLRHNALHLLI